MTNYIKLFFIIFMFAPRVIFSQTVLLPGEEAPVSVFSTKIYDEDVDLFLSGSWDSDLKLGFGFSWDSVDKEVKTSSFPGMASGLQFTNTPDLLISLWLMNSYFFDASFIDDYKLNTILFGYESQEDTFLKSIRFGNTDIGYGKYSYLNIPEASADSFGGMARFGTDKAEHQFLIRFDPAELQEKNYIGKYEVDSARVKPESYIKGRFFLLPDSNVEDLVVYLEDINGPYSDGIHNFRVADSSDAVISAQEGLVFFRSPLNVRAAVSYTKAGVSVGDATLGIGFLARDSDGLSPGSAGILDITGTDQFQFNTADEYLGIDMDSWALTINSETSLLIYEPGVFSPFEILSFYSLPYSIPSDPALFRAVLADINLNTGTQLEFSPESESGLLRLLFTGDSLREPGNRYPLAVSIGQDALIYEQERGLTGKPPEKELLFQKLVPAGAYNLGEDVLEGSISVTVNGIKETRYTFNSDSGILEFSFPVPEDAGIKINYRTAAESGKGGDLLLGFGSEFNFSDNFKMDVGAGLRWNILDSKYIDKPGKSGGSILGAGGLTYSGDNLNFELNGGISLYNPNTTGILRLAGMNESGFNIPLSYDFLYPAASPETAVATGTRGKLYYRDYHYYDSSGSSVLKDYDWDLPGNQIYPYTDGGRTGPYIAGTGSETDGNAVVLDYDLAPGEWTGGRAVLTMGSEPLDLSGTRTISFRWKHLAPSGSITAHIRVGKLAEDLDGDGVLDKELSLYSSGFNFDDSSDIMKIGLAPDGKSGNGISDSEDLDGNGILDGEGSSLVLTKSQGTDFSPPDSTWQTVTLNLSPSDRSKLRSVTGFEIIITDDGSGSSGKLLISSVSMAGAESVIKPDTAPAPDQVVISREISETETAISDPLLVTSYPETSVYLSGTGVQKVEEIIWDRDGTWESTRFTEAVDLADYSRISFYMKTPSPAPDSITFSFTSPRDRGVSITFIPVESSSWIKYTLDYRLGTLTADNSLLTATGWNKRDPQEKNINRITLTALCTSGGQLLIDEIHMEEPVTGISGAVSSVFDYQYPGSLIDYRNKTLVSNFKFLNISRYSGRDFASGFSNNRDSEVSTSTDISLTILNMTTNWTLNLQWQDNIYYSSPGISFTLPLLGNRLIIRDSYSEISIPQTNSVSREDLIRLNLPDSSLIIKLGSFYTNSKLTRNWGVSANSSREQGLFMNTGLDLKMAGSEDPYSNKNFLEKFLESYRLYIPSKTANDRTTSININPGFRNDGLLLNMDEAFISKTGGTDTRTLSTVQNLSANAKFILFPGSPNPLTIEPEYKKFSTIENPLETDINFYSDTVESFSAIGSQNYYFTAVPVWEIFYPDFAEQFFAQSGSDSRTGYNPEMSFTVSRTIGSEPLDIIIPSALSIKVSRDLKREYDSTTDTVSINMETRSTALNVFGNLGTSSITDLYQTEEITTVFSVTGDFESYSYNYFRNPGITLNYNLFLNFIISRESSLRLESGNTWKWNPLEWKSSTEGEFKWKSIPEKSIQIPPLFKGEGEEKPYFEHNEKLTLSLTGREAEKEFSLGLKGVHNTSLVISETGRISLFAGVAFDRKSITTDTLTTNYYKIGMETGISVKLTF